MPRRSAAHATRLDQQLRRSTLEPAWSPDGTKIAFASNRDGNYRDLHDERGRHEPDAHHQRLRPQAQPELAAAPRTPATPAPRAQPRCASRSYRPTAQCTSPNRTHGPPLAYGSCNPPVPESSELTTGTPDANGAGDRHERLRAVRDRSSGTPPLRRTRPTSRCGSRSPTCASRARSPTTRARCEARHDRAAHRPQRSGGDPGDRHDVLFPLTTQCTPTADATSAPPARSTTTLDTLIPGAIAEGQRTILQLGQVQVIDGGPDGDTDTDAEHGVPAAGHLRAVTTYPQNEHQGLNHLYA